MRISVVIPSLNRAGYLMSAIESVLAPEVVGVECVVVDAISTDGTLEILKQAKVRFGDAFVYLHEKDEGPSDAFNKGCRIARGDILACIGADDVVNEGTLEFVSEYFALHPERSIVYGECSVVDEAGEWIGRYAVKDFSLKIQLDEGCCVQFPSCYFRKEVFETIGGCDTNNVYGDLDWIARAASRFTFNRVDRTFSRFRLYKGGLTGSTWNTALPAAMFRLNRKYGGRLFSSVGKRYLLLCLQRLPVISSILAANLRRMDWVKSPVDGDYVVFGAALTGYACHRALRATGRHVVGFIDNFPPTSGRYCSLLVERPEDFLDRTVSDEIAGIVIATGGFPYAMRRQLRRLGWKGNVYRF